MTRIHFQSRRDQLLIMNPLAGFEAWEQTVEIRRDPLLGHTAIYNPALRDKAKIFLGEVDRDLVAKAAEETAESCVFCPHSIHKTARYPEALMENGRIEIGEAVLFPNLFALGAYHAVVTVSRQHFLALHEFSPERLFNALQAMHRFAEAVSRHDSNARYLTLNANYLFPAGASLVHPHFQLLMTAEPYAHHAWLLEACRRFRAAEGVAYHEELASTERQLGERYIARRGEWHWLSAYAPLGTNEVLALHEGQGDFLRLKENDLADLAEGLSRVLRLYGDLGHLSFNFSLYSLRDAGSDDGFNCLLRCITRQNPYENYRCDDFFLQKLLQTELILNLPESLARRAQRFLT